MIVLENINLTFPTFNQPLKALDDINLTFNRYGLTIIMGPSGCGKTSLLNLISLLEKPTSGYYFFNNKKTHNLTISQKEAFFGQQMALIFQHYYLLDDFTVLENIAIPLLINGVNSEEAYQAALELLTTFNLFHLKDQSAKTLSGGEAQRVSLLRALIKNTPIILLDEPTGAIDETQAQLFLDNLKQISINKIVIMVTHNQFIAPSYADRIIHMQAGKIIHDQTINERPLVKNKHFKLHKNKANLSLIIKKMVYLSSNNFKYSLVSMIIGVMSLLLTIGFKDGFALNAIKQPLTLPDAQTIYIKQKEQLPIANSPLQLVKYQRPNQDIINQLLSEHTVQQIDYSLRGLLGNDFVISYDNRPLANIQFEPIIDGFSDEEPCTVYLNQEAAKQLGKIKQPFIDTPLVYEKNSQYAYYLPSGQMVLDSFVLKKQMIIKQIIAEKRLIKRPIIYYDHYQWADILQNMAISNLSLITETPFTWYDRIRLANNDEMITNQEVIAKANQEQLDHLFKQIDNVYTKHGSYFDERTFIEANGQSIHYGLIFFMIIASVSSLLTLLFSQMRFFKVKQRQIAILWQLGLKKKDIIKIFSFINLIITTISLIAAFLITPLITYLLNELLNKTSGYDQLIKIPTHYQDFPFAIHLLILITVLSVVYIISHLLVRQLSKSNLAMELKDLD